MQKIEELAKENKLSGSLMSDKNFTEEAKKIFKSENIELTDEQLKQLVDEIESQLKKSNILEDEELEQISGGVTGKGVARAVIKITLSAVSGFLSSSIAGESSAGSDKSGLNAKRRVAGALAGAALGYNLAKIICSEFGLDEK